MTIVNVELVSKTVNFQVVYSKAEDEEEADEYARFLTLTGEPRYSGTYKYTDIELLKGEERLQLPKAVTIKISSSPEVSSADGTITYLEKCVDEELGIVDEELGINDSEEIYIDVNLGLEQFRDIWKLRTLSPGVEVLVGASFRAPETDISGHLVKWNVNEIGGLDSKPLEVSRFWFELRIPNRESET